MGVLTDKGFLRLTYDDILTLQIEKAKYLFGDDIETSEQSILGKYMRIMCYDLSLVYEELEMIYYARFPNTSSGASLDRLCVFAGLCRNPPSRATHLIEFTGEIGYTIPTGFLVCDTENLIFYTEDDWNIGETGMVTGKVYCSIPGEIGNLKTGSIDQIMNADINVSSIRHIEVIDEGKEEESDTELRKRFSLAVSGSGSATADSIRAEIMRIQEVSGCVIVENNSDKSDSEGRPPNSFECFVLSPDGRNQEIAQAIFNKRPIGIKSFGTLNYKILDKGGVSHEVHFSKVLEITLWIHIVVTVNNYFESDGAEKIKANLMSHVNTLANGKSLPQSGLYSFVHSVSGVERTDTLALSKDGTTFDTNMIECLPSEVIRTSVSNISVEVKGLADE